MSPTNASLYITSKVFQNSALNFRNLPYCTCEMEIEEILICFMLTYNFVIPLPLEALQQLIESVGIFEHSMETLL